MTKETLADYLVTIIRPLLTPNMVESPRVDIQSDDMGVLLTLTVPDGDFGKVVGREGSTIKAIRTIVTAVGMTYKIRTSVKINDPVKDQR